ncbi:ABC transporter ATP-binding protein [Nonomuraea longicatena]
MRRTALTAWGRELPVVLGVDLVIERGQTLALLGAPGSGKSVTAAAIMGLLDRPDARVSAAAARFGGRDLLSMSPRERRALRGSQMSMVFQDARAVLDPARSVGDQLGALFREHLGVSRDEARARSIEMLGLAGVPAARRRADDRPPAFSAEMLQRVLVAMAVALEPDLVIADEPTTALGEAAQAQVLDLIGRLRRELGTAVLLITRDLALAAEVGDHVAVMHAGRVVETGDVHEVFDRPAHPRTEALLGAAPGVGRPEAQLLDVG